MNQPCFRTCIGTHLITLMENMDVYFGIGILLKNNISDAAVIDNENNLCGILSEKDCLRFYAIGSFYDMPGEHV